MIKRRIILHVIRAPHGQIAFPVERPASIRPSTFATVVGRAAAKQAKR